MRIVRRIYPNLIPAVVAGIIAALGTWGSVWYQNAGVSDQWLRAKKLEAYSKVIGRIATKTDMSVVVYEPLSQYIVSQDSITLSHTEVVEIWNAIGESIVLAGPKLRPKLALLHASLKSSLAEGGGITKSINGFKFSPTSGLTKLTVEIIEEMRKELSIND